jgi:hypothetical protein
MFPLNCKDFPSTADELASAIEDALRDVFTLPKSAGVTIEGADDFPHIESLRIDLDGARLKGGEPPPKPAGVGKRKPGVTIDQLEISGHPIQYEQTKLDLSLNAAGLTFEFGHDKSGRGLLVLADAEEGNVEAKIKKKDIEALALEAATLAARQQGVSVQELDLDLRSTGERSIAADVRVKAKKLMVSGVLRVAGAAEVDDDLNATLSRLTCTGEGMIGSAAAGFLQKYLKAYDGRQIPLMAFSLGDVTLRDLSVKIDNSVHVMAAFGSQSASAKKKKKSTKHRASGTERD